MPRYIIQNDVQYDVFDLPPHFVVYGDLNLSDMGLTQLPDLHTVHVLGNFYCDHNMLTTLDNSPATVERGFFADHNMLTSLHGCTPKIPMLFSVHHNLLQTLEYGPTNTGGYICSDNLLKSLRGISQNEMVCFDCRNNRLRNLEFAPFMVQTTKYSGNKISTKRITEYLNLVAEYQDTVQRGVLKSKYSK